MGNAGLALQRGVVLAAAGNLPPQDPKLTPKRDPKSAKKDPKSAARAPKTGRAGNGKRVWFGVLCEHLRAFALVSQKPVRGRTGAGARTNSPSREHDEAQKALEAQRRERTTLNIHYFL